MTKLLSTTYRICVWLLSLLAINAQAEKVWTSPISGLWRDGTNWTGNTPPDNTSFLRITNDLSKTITIDALTPSSELTVQMLTLNAPPGVTNTLLLSDVGTNNPLIFQTGLELQSGAAVVITNSALAVQLMNDHVNIDGSFVLASGLVDFGDLTVTTRVGRATSGVLTIHSGIFSAGTMTVGGLANSTGAVNMTGGTLNLSGLLSIGRNFSTQGSFALLGGEMNVSNFDTRIGDSGAGFMVISNATATVTNLQMGRDALSAGTLTLNTGGLVESISDVSIARFPGSTGLVSMVGGKIAADGFKIFVGRGGTGELDVTNGIVQASSVLVAADTTNSVNAAGTLVLAGGSVVVSSNAWVGSASYSTGQVFMTGGSLAVTNASGTAFTAISSGEMVINSGEFVTDSLLVTNSAGRFTFNGGTLSTRNTRIASGTPFVIGDGTRPATLRLEGGTHSFADGLVISSNATLTGCGTVIANIVNHGTISTNCGGTITGPVITQAGGTGNRISVLSQIGVTYTLEFKNALTDPSWTPILPAMAGTGVPITLQDTNAIAPVRFYRITALPAL